MLSSSLLKSYDYLIELMLINPFDKQMWVELRMHFTRVWSKNHYQIILTLILCFLQRKIKHKCESYDVTF